jgi:hypothetical protein
MKNDATAFTYLSTYKNSFSFWIAERKEIKIAVNTITIGIRSI